MLINWSNSKLTANDSRK